MEITKITFWFLGFFAIILAKPVEKKNKGWWKRAVFYQIYPRSFKDSNNDGVGDLKGITSKLEHLKDAGINAAWLSPIYKSPQVDAGYDISDFRDIHYEYGTMDDFTELVREAKKLDIKIIMDLVPNHSSDEHEWFIKSANREPGYEDYYVWRDGKSRNTEPPNNWRSAFHGSAWTFNEKRKQWYLHQFATAQPDLNYRNPKIVQEMTDIMTFWMERGVSGFRIDAVPFLYERQDFPDEPLSNNPSATPDDFEYLNHIYTQNLPETFDMVYQWRKHIDDFPDDEEKVIMTECYTPIPQIMSYYGNETNEGAHFPFNFLFITDLNANSSAADIVFSIEKWLSYLPRGKTTNWVLGNHDNHRVASRYGKRRADGLNLLHLILPGVKIVYNGEEFAMEDGKVTYEEGQDPQGCNAGPDRYDLFTRDPERTPLQWDGTVNSGFNKGAKTWLPVSDKYKENNLELQSKPGADTNYHVFQKGIALRKHKTLQDGDLTVKAYNPRVIVLKRELDGSETIVFVFNIGDRTEKVDLNILSRIPEKLRVEITSAGSAHRVGQVESSSDVTLGPQEALVLIT